MLEITHRPKHIIAPSDDEQQQEADTEPATAACPLTDAALALGPAGNDLHRDSAGRFDPPSPHSAQLNVGLHTIRRQRLPGRHTQLDVRLFPAVSRHERAIIATCGAEGPAPTQ